jgi:translation initiation factor IF-2
MTETQTRRLSKVAREFNVGISTIVDFLSDKGHNIESNPNTKIDDKLYSLLFNEFQSEKSDKEKSQQVKLASRPARETLVAEKEKPAEPKEKSKSAPEEEILIKNIHLVREKPEPTPTPVPEKPVSEKPVAEKETIKEEKKEEPQEELIKTKVDEKKVKVVGKIDLDELSKKKKKSPAKEEEKPEIKEDAKKAEEEVEAKKTLKKKKAKEEEEDKVVEAKQEEKPVIEEPKVEEKPAVAPPVEEEIYKSKVQKLEGPTILGKIILPVEDKKKPVASSTSYDKEKNKKKRKRIKKSADEPNAAAPSAPGAAPQQQNRFRDKSRPGAPQRTAKVEPTEEEIQNQIKETMARLSGGGNKSKAAKYRKAKRENVSQQMQEELERQEQEKSILKVTEFVSANQLATMMGVPVTEIISTCMSLGLFVSINQRLDAETISIVAEEFGYKVEFVTVQALETYVEEEDKPEDLQDRPPIVTVMGHVDHGKTSLLDYVRKANVIAGEAGGITQHIGAYNVKLESGKHITFLDTPGHEAFTAMRARGAKVTDVAIIVVAADDSVMPQTIEAINHAQAAGVPLVFAINKIDKPGANPEKIKEQLANMNILVEDWGGKYQSQEISAKNGIKIAELLDKVLLEAEILDLKANPNRNAHGTIIESQLDKGRGYVSTVLVQKGSLKVGDVVLAGCFSGRVKALYNERGQIIKEAGPSMPAQLLGLNGAPQAGDTFSVMSDEREAREIASKRMQLQREQGIRTQKHITLDEIGRRLAIGDFKELNIIVKGDVDGSIEALSDSLLKLSTDKVQVNIIHKSVGQITESDVLLASASNAIILGFQVRPSQGARKLAESEQIDIRLYSIIYDAINEVKAAMEGMLAPEFEEKITCNIEVRETFKITKVGTIAGCMVLDGKVNRNTKVRVIRDGIVVYTGELGSLKRFKDDVKEVATGYECGLNIHNFNDIKVGDIIEGYEMVEMKRKL